MTKYNEKFAEDLSDKIQWEGGLAAAILDYGLDFNDGSKIGGEIQMKVKDFCELYAEIVSALEDAGVCLEEY